MAARNDSANQMALAERHGTVVQLRLAGASFPRIARLTGYSTARVHQIWQEALARQRRDRDVEEHRDEVYADIEAVLEQLRPFVTAMPMPEDACLPDKQAIGAFVKVLAMKARLLGLDAPRGRAAFPVGANVDNPVAEEFVERLALWQEERERRGENRPPLPREMTERPAIGAGSPSTNGHHATWSSVLSRPRLEPE